MAFDTAINAVTPLLTIEQDGHLQAFPQLAQIPVQCGTGHLQPLLQFSKVNAATSQQHALDDSESF